MRILVTGAGGYLGQGIVYELLNDGWEVIASDINLDQVDPRSKLVQGDIFTITESLNHFGQLDAVLHLAWRNGFIHNDPSHMEDLSKHYCFLRTLALSGIGRIAVMGTMHEIGYHEGAVDDNTLCNPLNLYGIAKNALRQSAFRLAAETGIKFQWLRGFYIVGISNFGNSIFSKLSAAEATRQAEFPFTLGQNAYDFLDYEDFCHRTARAIEQDEITGIINICSGQPVKLCDRVEQFISDNKYKIHLQYGAFPDRAYDSKAIWGDSSKIDAILASHA